MVTEYVEFSSDREHPFPGPLNPKNSKTYVSNILEFLLNLYTTLLC